MTDYQASLKRLTDKADELLRGEAPAGTLQVSVSEGRTKWFSLRFQALALAGDLRGCAELDAEIAPSIEDTPAKADLWLLRACIAVKLHRLKDAQRFLRTDPLLPRATMAQLLQADIHLQHGQYALAKESVQQVVKDDPTWDGLARLAHVHTLLGDIKAADELYEAAEDELTAKQMQQFAWLELQRGFMFFERGDYARTATHYQRADAAYSGYWLTGQRIAELIGARGEFAPALKLYQRLYDETPRPEWAHAMGDLLALSGDAKQAHAWRLKALEGYHESADRGEVHYLHLLVDLCCELPGMTADAVKRAKMDVEGRSNHATEGDLAWALYRNGEAAVAREHLERALTFGAESSRLYLQAACIYAALNETELSVANMRCARVLNPSPARAKFRIPMAQLKCARVDLSPAKSLTPTL
jgi:tetratricopeptide (TPR) repeat protein